MRKSRKALHYLIMEEKMKFNTLSQRIGSKLIDIPKYWDGRESILEMKESGYPQWKQMEWIGFYFQTLSKVHNAFLFHLFFQKS